MCRHLNSAGRGLLKRVVCKIDLGEHRHFGGPDRPCQSLLTAAFWIIRGHEVDSIAMGTNHQRSMLDARIERARVVRLIQIEPLTADLKCDSNVVILSDDSTGEKCAGNGGRAK
jgi:hypothetical protein